MANTAKTVGTSLSRFNAVLGDKGGVGKSFTALALIDYLLGRGVPVVVIEADTQNPDVARMYADTIPCYNVDLTTEIGWMDVMDAVIANPGSTFVMSTPGGVGRYLKKDLPSFEAFLAQRKTPVTLSMWWAMNPQHDSVNLLDEALTHYGQHFQEVRVVCNTHFSDNRREAFFLWDESPLRARLEKQGAKTLYMNGLNLRVVTKLFDPAKILPFADAADAALGEKVGLTGSEMFKLSDWRLGVQVMFDGAFPMLVPAKAPAIAASMPATAVAGKA